MRKRAEHLSSSMVRSLTHYFFTNNADQFSLEINRQKDRIEIRIRGKLKLTPDELEDLQDILDQPNVPNVEHYYSELLDSGDYLDLSILGSLTDESQVTQNGDELEIFVCKHFKDTGFSQKTS